MVRPDLARNFRANVTILPKKYGHQGSQMLDLKSDNFFLKSRKKWETLGQKAGILKLAYN
jgi:hypothetical protein